MWLKYKGKNIDLVAISADTREDLAAHGKKEEIFFPLLSDPNQKTIKAYGVLMEDSKIAVPAVFIVTKDGHIGWRYIGESMTDRPDSDVVFKKAAEINGQ